MIDDMAIIEMYVIFCCGVLCRDIFMHVYLWIIRRCDVYFLFII